jgi:hypothetical protein
MIILFSILCLFQFWNLVLGQVVPIIDDISSVYF